MAKEGGPKANGDSSLATGQRFPALVKLLCQIPFITAHGYGSMFERGSSKATLSRWVLGVDAVLYRSLLREQQLGLRGRS